MGFLLLSNLFLLDLALDHLLRFDSLLDSFSLLFLSNFSFLLLSSLSLLHRGNLGLLHSLSLLGGSCFVLLNLFKCSCLLGLDLLLSHFKLSHFLLVGCFLGLQLLLLKSQLPGQGIGIADSRLLAFGVRKRGLVRSWLS